MDSKMFGRVAALAAAALVLCGLSGCRTVLERQEMTRTVITEEVHSLEMDIGAADIRIEEGREWIVETDNPYISVDVVNGMLVLREKFHIADLEGSELILRYPEDTVFRSADLDVGAGVLRVSHMTCGELDLDLGAGKSEIQCLTVTGEAEITGGAGQITVLDGEIQNLDLELGVGECAIRARLTGNADIDAGVGKLEISIPGHAADYTIRTENGLGSITIDGALVGSGTYGSGPNRMELTGGVGSIELRFETE